MDEWWFECAILAFILEYDPINYSISFDGNDADDGEMDAITATYDEEYTLTANTFTRDGYTFTGWNTEADGSGTSYEDGATVTNLTTEDGATVTLYAQWEENTSDYTITVTEYTGDTLEAEYDYEEGAIILYFIDGFDTAEYAQLGAYEISMSTSSTTYFIDYANTYASIHEGYKMNTTYKIYGYCEFVDDSDSWASLSTSSSLNLLRRGQYLHGPNRC